VPDDRPQFAELQRELIGDLNDAKCGLRSRQPFPRWRGTCGKFAHDVPILTAYTRVLMGDFSANAGRSKSREFHTPDDFAKLREKTLINATGYGARALFGDQTVTRSRAVGASDSAAGYRLWAFLQGVSLCRAATAWCFKWSAITTTTVSMTIRPLRIAPKRMSGQYHCWIFNG